MHARHYSHDEVAPDPASKRDHIDQLRDRGDSRDAIPASAPIRELEAFAQWFADWWLRRGRHLTHPDRCDTNAPTDGPVDPGSIEIRE